MTIDLTLYHSPGACSRVPLILLEAAGAAYDLQLVRLHQGENKKPDFQRLNPKGKVPVLAWRGQVLTENMAIACFLAQQFPGAGLMPPPQQPWEFAQALSWLS